MNERIYVASQLLASLMQLHPAETAASLVPRAVAAADALLSALEASADQPEQAPSTPAADDK